MQVDQDNFLEQKEQIFKLLENDQCEFIAIDLEMTGIKQHDDPEFKDDLPFERYNKMRLVPSKHNIIQIGISIFIKDENQNYIAHPFNVYVFPKSNAVFNPDINLQLGSIEFNCKYNMDYNRWIYKGVSYIQQENYQKIFQNMCKEEHKMEQENESDDILSKLIPAEQSKILQEKQNLLDWYKDESKKENFIINELKFYQKKYILAVQAELLPLTILTQSLSTQRLNNLEFKKCTQDEKAQHIQEIKDQQFKKFEEMAGFTQVMNKIYEAKLPVVTHNGFFDHLFMYDTFIGPLPFSYIELKQKLTSNFPLLYDTKRISTLLQLKITTSLENLKNYIIENQDKLFNENKSIIKLNENSQNYDFFNENNKQYFHEAGFDAYLTGWIFIQFQNKFKQEIEQFKGQFPIFQSNYIINIQGEDQQIYDTLTFVVSEKNSTNLKSNGQASKDQQQSNLKKLRNSFSPDIYGYNVSIRAHLQGKYYFIELFEEAVSEHKEKFIKQVISLKSLGFNVQSTPTYIMERKALQDAYLQKHQQKQN